MVTSKQAYVFAVTGWAANRMWSSGAFGPKPLARPLRTWMSVPVPL